MIALRSRAYAEHEQEADVMAFTIGEERDHDQSLNMRCGAGLMTRASGHGNPKTLSV